MQDQYNFALIIDIPSIQLFVFGSNKMRINLGASYIIKKLYHRGIKHCLTKLDQTKWYSSKDHKQLPAIIYEGGGNVALLFETAEKQKDFMRQFSQFIIENYPGLTAAFGISKIKITDIENGVNFFDSLHQNLRENKRKQHLQTHIPIQSITGFCNFNQQAAEIVLQQKGKLDEGEANYYLSSLAKTQWLNEIELTESESEAYAFLQSNAEYPEPKWVFTNELEKLGQNDEKSYISIVHIDGNSMGEQFKNCNSIESLQHLSKEVKMHYEWAVKKCFEDFVSHIVPLLVDHPKFNLKTEAGKTCLPFRPLILSGDDLTFVAHGNLGIYLAEEFLKLISSKSIEVNTPTGTLVKYQFHACAGIAIVGTHFPFYQAYQLAEALCTRAKKHAYEADGESYLDFAVATSSGTMNDLDSFIEDSYKINGSIVKSPPYLIASNNESTETGFDLLKRETKDTAQTLSSSQRHKLRSLLNGDENELKLFEHQTKLINKTTDFEIDLTNQSKYYSQFELLEFYPFELFGHDENKTNNIK